MKLAHYSDIHITHFPLSGKPALKRLAAVASYTLAGRGKHFEHSDERIARLLEDVDAQGVDHALCTGDLTGVSTEAEFVKVAELFGPRLQQPARVFSGMSLALYSPWSQRLRLRRPSSSIWVATLDYTAHSGHPSPRSGSYGDPVWCSS